MDEVVPGDEDVGLAAHDVDRYTLAATMASEEIAQFITAAEAVAATLRQLPSSLARSHSAVDLPRFRRDL
ncbi:hypothetical protein [Streptomyces sp. NPDC048269]|uniref:hypothetical protein n=1 Tax=Streptomyces sp. NPDC048269 TaxID=3155753 RepID=UPI003448F089